MSGTISDLRSWWDQLSSFGPAFGYFQNASKTWLVIKEQFQSHAIGAFQDTAVNVTSDGRPHLGAPIGSAKYCDNFVTNRVNGWISEIKTLSSVAISQPHAAYAAFCHGLISRWLYISRTVPDISHHFQHLEDILRTTFIPALIGHSPNDLERLLFTLPSRLGGLGIINPITLSAVEFPASFYVTEPLQTLILTKNVNYSEEVRCNQFSRKLEIKQSKATHSSSVCSDLCPQLSTTLQKAVTLASEKGASSWLSALPLREYGFALHKTAFHDALALRYGWLPSRMPSHCTCGSKFSIEHALSCPKGGFPSIRHNEVRDLTATLLTDVCHDVKVEPDLQPLNNEAFHHKTANIQDGARLDISVNGFWGGRYEKCYIDVRVFNPFAPSNSVSSLQSCYRKHESVKKRAYEL